MEVEVKVDVTFRVPSIVVMYTIARVIAYQQKQSGNWECGQERQMIAGHLMVVVHIIPILVVSVHFPNGMDVVSVHLDFARAKIRKNQAKQLASKLKTRNRPLVQMGDFNAQWDKEPTLQEIVRSLQLKSYRPAGKIPTFAKSKKRID